LLALAFFTAKKEHPLTQIKGLLSSLYSLRKKNIQKPTVYASASSRYLRCNGKISKNLNYMLLLIAAVVVVVVPTVVCVVKHLHPELDVAFPLEVHQEADLQVVGTTC
jgi:hypothetical protein